MTHEGITWLEQSAYNKAIGQFRLQMNGVFEPFRMYGQDAYIPGAIEEITRLAVDFSIRVRGVDHPISLERIRQGK